MAHEEFDQNFRTALTLKPIFSTMLPLSEIWKHSTERLNEPFKREALLDGFGDSLNSLHAQSIL